MWSVAAARRLAAEQLASLGDRWAHVQAVGGLAEDLLKAGLVSERVAVAAWLHDVGYAHLWTPIRQPNQRHEEEHQVTTDKDHDDEDRLLTMAEVATWLGTTERFHDGWSLNGASGSSRSADMSGSPLPLCASSSTTPTVPEAG